MKKTLIAAAMLAVISMGSAIADDDVNGCLGCGSYNPTPSYGDIAYGIGSVWWGWIVGLNGGYSGSDTRCDCRVGGKDRPQ